MILLTVFFECGRILFFFSEFLNSISLQISIKKRVCVIQCNKCSKTYKKKQLYIQFVNCGWKNVLIKPYLLNLFLIITCTIERYIDLNNDVACLQFSLNVVVLVIFSSNFYKKMNVHLLFNATIVTRYAKKIV